MASLQAHLAVWILKWRTKRRLRHCRDYRLASQILRPLPYKPPASVRITNARLNGVPGEWVESPSSAEQVLLYLHGGGYFACSAETHRPITAFFAMHGFRVFAPNYRLAPENPFPAAVEDAAAVYRGLFRESVRSRALLLPATRRAAHLRFRSCSLSAPRARPFPLPPRFSLRGPILPPPANRSARTPGAARSSTARPSPQPLACIWPTPIRATRWHLRCTPISQVFRRCLSTLAQMRPCGTIPRGSPKKRVPRRSAWS